LRIGFTVAPILFGIDKFAHVLVNWDKYMALATISCRFARSAKSVSPPCAPTGEGERGEHGDADHGERRPAPPQLHRVEK
jgi:hypothetical protein